LTKDPKQKAPSTEASQSAAAAAKRAEKVRSSRYEWDGSSGENENPAPQKQAARGSFLGALRAWVRKCFSWNRDFFDKDDDATPSAA
jgi:hypothetical protein